jgi:hypothetical protein
MDLKAKIKTPRTPEQIAQSALIKEIKLAHELETWKINSFPCVHYLKFRNGVYVVTAKSTKPRQFPTRGAAISFRDMRGFDAIPTQFARGAIR